MMTRPRLLLTAALFLVGLAALPADSARAGEPEVHEDTDYRFRILSPGKGWRLLPEADARRMAPDAIAGLSDMKGLNFLVIAEEAPASDLDALVAMIQSNMSLEEPSFGEVESLTYQGLPARRWTSDGRMRSLDLRYRHLVVQRAGFVFQLIGYGLRSPPSPTSTTPNLDLLAEHFSFTEGVIRPRKVTQPTHDVMGIGWRVRSGVYQDAANAIEWKPPAGWRLAVGSELREVNDSACVGLVAADPEAYIIVIVERARGVEPGPFLEQLRAGPAENATAAGAPTKARVGGREFVMHPFHLPTEVPIRLHHGARWDDGQAVQVQWWAVESLVERARPKVVEALAALRFLEAPQVAALTKELVVGADPQDSVGPEFSLRGGVYRDFGQGFTWTKPPSFWIVTPGQEARARNADATLYLEDPSTGLHGMVIAEEQDGLEPAAFHRLLVERLEPKDPPPMPAVVELLGAQALVSELRPGTLSLPLRYVVASVVREGRAYQLLLWGLEGNVEAARPGLEAAVRGLAFPERLVADEQVEGAHVDHRLGFRLRRPPGEGWRLSRITPKAIAPVATLVLFEHRRGAVLGGAFCALSEGQDERFMRDMVLQMLRQRVGATDAEPEESSTMVAGLPARRMVLAGKQRMVAWLLNRGRTFYLVLAGSEPGAGFRDEDAHTLLALL